MRPPTPIANWRIAWSSARTWLAETGYNPEYGARSVHRLIQREVKDKLADELLFGKLTNGGTVKVGLKDKQLEFQIEPNKKKVRRGGKKKDSDSDKEREEEALV